MKTTEISSRKSKDTKGIAGIDPLLPAQEKLAILEWLQQLERLNKIEIIKPIDGSETCFPFDIVVKWTADIQKGSFKAILQGTNLFVSDLTSSFSIDEKNRTATLSGYYYYNPCLGIGYGDQILTVSADFPSMLFPKSVVSKQTVCNFRIPKPPTAQLNVALEPNQTYKSIDLVQGMQTAIKVTLVSVDSNTGIHPDMEVLFYQTDYPSSGPKPIPGIATNTPLLIKADQNSALMYFTVDRTVDTSVPYHGCLAAFPLDRPGGQKSAQSSEAVIITVNPHI